MRGCAQCKRELGAKINERMQEIRERRKYYEENPQIVEEIIKKGSEKARVEAQKILQEVSKCNSMWFIPPLQDILHLSQKYYAEDSKEERINIPGTVTQFNWTYRMPVCIEELSKNKEIISNIKLLSRS